MDKEQELREIGWLIERKNFDGSPLPHWYAENEAGWHWWTPVAADAKRFDTLDAAKAFPPYGMIVSDPNIALTEHVFLARRLSSDEQAEVVAVRYRNFDPTLRSDFTGGWSVISAEDPNAGMIQSSGRYEFIALYASPSPSVATGGVTEALNAAIGMCEQYAEFIRRVPAADIEQHPYLPEIEQVIEVGRLALREREAPDGN